MGRPKAEGAGPLLLLGAPCGAIPRPSGLAQHRNPLGLSNCFLEESSQSWILQAQSLAPRGLLGGESPSRRPAERPGLRAEHLGLRTAGP